MFYKICLIGIEQNLFHMIFQDKMADFLSLPQTYNDKMADILFFNMSFLLKI